LYTGAVEGDVMPSGAEERGAAKNRSSGFNGRDLGLARRGEPVDGFSGQGVGI